MTTKAIVTTTVTLQMATPDQRHNTERVIGKSCRHFTKYGACGTLDALVRYRRCRFLVCVSHPLHRLCPFHVLSSMEAESTISRQMKGFMGGPENLGDIQNQEQLYDFWKTL